MNEWEKAIIDDFVLFTKTYSENTDYIKEFCIRYPHVYNLFIEKFRVVHFVNKVFISDPESIEWSLYSIKKRIDELEKEFKELNAERNRKEGNP